MRQREYLGRVRERHGPLAGGVEHGEQINKQRNQRGARGGQRHEGAQARGEQGPDHLGEGEQQEGAAAEGVDGPEGGEGEEPVDEAEAEGGEQGLEIVGAVLLEDGGGVEGDDVDAAHLLGDHDGEGGEGGAAHAGDGEELDEALVVAAVAKELDFEFELRVDVEDVARDLERVVAEFGHGHPGFCVPVLFHVPAGGFGTHVNEDEERDGREEGGACCGVSELLNTFNDRNRNTHRASASS